METRQKLRDSCNYEYLGECEVGVYNRSDQLEGPCGEPAMARIWWDDYDADNPDSWEHDKALLVCQEHFDELMQF